MSEPRCPFCGEMMVIKSTFYDKYSGRHSGHAKCWGCGAQGPIAKGNTTEVTTNRALKLAISRPRSKPLLWASLKSMQVVWLEDVDKKEVIPAFTQPDKDKSVMYFMTANRSYIKAGKADYGRRWRAWPSQPTGKERTAAAWEGK